MNLIVNETKMITQIKERFGIHQIFIVQHPIRNEMTITNLLMSSMDILLRNIFVDPLEKIFE
jgi:hypothetical protein